MPYLIFFEGDNPFIFLLAGPILGAAFYFVVFRFYRNTNKSHSFEKETRVASKNFQANDNKIGERNGQRNRYMRSANHTKHRSRVKFEKANG